MALKTQTIDEAIHENGAKVLVHAPPGYGKTVLSVTTVMDEEWGVDENLRSLIVNAESGLRSLKTVPQAVKDRIDVVTVGDLTDLGDIYNELCGGHCYDWVILDSLSEIAEVCLSEHKAESKDPRQAYGKLADDMFAMIRLFRDLPHVCVYMSCKQGYAEDASGKTRFRPMMPGKQLTQGIGYLFDEVFAIRVIEDEEGDEVRVLQTAPDLEYDCKDRSGLMEPAEPASLAVIARKMGIDYAVMAAERAKIDSSEPEVGEEETPPAETPPEETNNEQSQSQSQSEEEGKEANE